VVEVDEEREADGRWHVRLDRATARAGDVVRAEVLRTTPLRVHLVMDDAAWPPGATARLDLVLECGGDRIHQSSEVHRESHAGSILTFAALSGEARLSWSGKHLAPGASHLLRIGEREEEHVEVELVYTGPPPPDELRVRVEAPEGCDTEEWWPDVACVDPVSNEYGVVELDGEGVAVLPGRARSGLPIVARAGPWWASRPVVAPERGDLTLALEPAGALVIVCERLWPEEAGDLRVRHEDGWALLGGPDSEWDLGTEIRCWSGTVSLRLAGMPAGTHRLRLSRGPFDLGTATVRIEGHKTAVLLLR
jgi:hypothetical protein